MKMKKILAAIAACAMSAAMLGMTAFAAGVEGDNEELDDGNVGGEEIIDTPNVDETPAVNETPAVDETPAVAETPNVATSPATGNAPIALAVIPVALAAAAVVAKKAK